MTDSSLSHTTHTAPTVFQTADFTPTLPLAQDVPANGVAAEETEEYTIKCRCDHPEDDGPNTVLCEECNTWQHIHCYYGDEPVPDIHECVDCRPRDIGTRLKRKRESTDTADRKSKKPTTKSHKKKIKEQPAGTNSKLNDKHDVGHVRGSNNSKENALPLKKTNNKHRASNSSHSHVLPLHPPHPPRRSGSVSYPLQSPSKSPRNVTPIGYQSERYTMEFLQLYDNDPGDTPMKANFFNDIGITACLASWSKDYEALTKATKGKKPQDIFHRCDQPLDTMHFPQLSKVCKEDSAVDCDGLHPRWSYLTIDSFTPQNTIVGELRGKIGHMSKYVEDPANRWDYLRHPLPFVFFHDHLPIYIDTRQEGSSCRYLRRSCRPNLSMKTFLENGSEYHFCFVANQDLEAGTELTTGWRLDEHISKFVQHNESGIKDEINAETAGSYVVEWVSKVLADFGTCACNDPAGCLMANYDRRVSTFSTDSAIYLPNGNTKKGRHASSHSTGHAAYSRSGSEAFKHQNGDDQEGYRSSSGSMRSRPYSRDMTPSNTMAHNKDTVETDREKRKIAQEEQMFKKLESEERSNKKKRLAGGSNVNTPATGTSKQLSHFTTNTPNSQPTTPAITSGSHHTDPTSSRTQSISPTTKTSSGVISSTRPRPKVTTTRSQQTSNSYTMPVHPDPSKEYADLATQVDMSDEENPSPPFDPKYFLTDYQWRMMKVKKWQEEFKAGKEAYLAAEAAKAAKTAETSETATTAETANAAETEDAAKTAGTADAAQAAPEGASVLQGYGDTHSVAESTSGLPMTGRKRLHEETDNDIQDVKDLVATSAILPTNSTSEKDRPLDEISKVDSDPTVGSPFKPPPPPPKPWALNHSSSFHRKEAMNGYRSADLRVQLPPKESFTNESASTPSIMSTPTFLTNAVAQSPLSTTLNSNPPVLTPSSGLTQPPPAKKKLTLGDYITRRSSNKTETLSTGTEDKHQTASSPTSSHEIVQPTSSLAEEAKDHPMDGSAIVETPKVGTTVSSHAINDEKMDTQGL